MTDGETSPPCGCCVRTDGHEPWCVCVQPDEYVIDDRTPGVMRPATPEDYDPPLADGMRVVRVRREVLQEAVEIIHHEYCGSSPEHCHGTCVDLRAALELAPGDLPASGNVTLGVDPPETFDGMFTGMRVVADPSIPRGKAYVAPFGQAVTFEDPDGFTRAILNAQQDVNALGADLAELRREVARLARELIQPTLTVGQREVMNERVAADLLALLVEEPSE